MARRTLGALALLALVLCPPAGAYRRPVGRISARGARLYQRGHEWRVHGFNYVCTCIPVRRRDDPVPSLRYFDHPTNRNLRMMRNGFAAMRRRGANAVRLYLGLFQVLDRRGRVRRRTLHALDRLLALAARQRLHIDLTGAVTWRRHLVPRWFKAASDRGRWDADARFWRAVARTGRDHDSLAFYELMSEPTVVRGGDLFIGHLYGYWFGRNVGRDGAQLAGWVRRMRHAVRGRDRRHLIGLGMFPVATGPAGPEAVASYLDLLLVHDYQPGTALERAFAATGKPVVIGETYPSEALSVDVWRAKLSAARSFTAGTLSFFHRTPPGRSRSRLFRSALRQFDAAKPSTPPRPRARRRGAASVRARPVSPTRSAFGATRGAARSGRGV